MRVFPFHNRQLPDTNIIQELFVEVTGFEDSYKILASLNKLIHKYIYLKEKSKNKK